MTEATNQCASAFGGVYDFYMERPWLSKLIAGVVWGIDVAPMYSNIDAIGELAQGQSVLDVPCGGGLALRGLSPDQNIRFVALDIDPEMLGRLRKKAAARGLEQIETVEGDMRSLPFENASFDNVCSFSGLHMINQPEQAIAEFARVIKPGGKLVGSSFVADGSRRWRWISGIEQRRSGIAEPPANAQSISDWLAAAGFENVTVSGRGFVEFHATRA